MIPLDTLDLADDLDRPLRFNPSPPGRLPMRSSETVNPETGELTTVYTAGKKHLDGFHGITGIRVTPFSRRVWLNAQVLGPRYSEGIHAGTLPLVSEALDRLGYLCPEPDDLRLFVVERADTFHDLPADDPHEMAEALRLLALTGGPRVELARKSKGDAVTVYASLPNGAGRSRVYFKCPDRGQMSRARQRPFLDAHPSVRDSLRNVFRAEVQAENRTAVRNAAGLAEGRVILNDLLTSTRTPVADGLDVVLNDWTQKARAPNALPSMPRTLDAFLNAPAGSFSDDAFRLLAVYVVDLVEGDHAAAEAVLRARYGAKNWGRYRRHVLAAVEARAVLASDLRPLPADPEPRAPAVRLLHSFAARVRSLESAPPPGSVALA